MFKKCTDCEADKIANIVLAFNSENDYEKLLETFLDKMMELTNSDAGTLYISDGNVLNFHIMKNLSKSLSKTSSDFIDLPAIPLNVNSVENVSAYSAINNTIVMIDDVYTENQFSFSGPKKYDRILGYKTTSMLVLPLVTNWEKKAEVLGVIQLINAICPSTGEVIPYNNEHRLSLVSALSKITANILANLSHINEIKHLFMSFTATMTQIIDERSAHSKNHTHKVAEYCKAFTAYLSEALLHCHHLHFDQDAQEQIYIAALLHDIGKVATPLHIMDKASRLEERLESVRLRFELKLCQLENDMHSGRLKEDLYEQEKVKVNQAFDFVEKANTVPFLSDEMLQQTQELSYLTYKNKHGEVIPLLSESEIEALSIKKGTLTAKERTIMQGHVESTERILNLIDFGKYYKNVYQWASNHHEFMDGTGYPNSLNSENLSAGSCIITIADIFEALIASDRPYKKPVPPEKAVEILKTMSSEGKLHKELVELFIKSRVWDRI